MALKPVTRQIGTRWSRWLAACFALSLLVNLGTVWGTWQRRADHLRELARSLVAANALAAEVFGPGPLPVQGSAQDPTVETLNLMVQLGRAEAAASQVYGDYGLDFGGGNLDSIWGVEQAAVALAGLPADARQSAEGQGLISDIQSTLTTYAGDVNRLGRTHSSHPLGTGEGSGPVQPNTANCL